ncbi:MAG: DUF3696 domain-containing protein [Bacteroidetes bacterium]|mgnify:CR=1 FL=1|jgi:predicted ATPase|nr:DUF3696 domain-containing protein [Bacteroidota bacterium]MBT6686743.1 DUF3696 domain-containing protein [Bacteroidota bacterium]MBT7145199.1 DUF3696 domain-containing protein [Bacteroidota bacterium]MBT7492964.1 DUF3696 domain-containing protein [Bacteroidota bacterium]
MLKSIKFKSYKSYKDWQELEIKPLTILFGKNSSGKSAVAKLPTLIEESLIGKFEAPILLNNNGVELGADFKDLVYGRIDTEVLEFELNASIPDDYNKKLKDEKLIVKIASNIGINNSPKIIYWKLDNRVFEYNHYNNSHTDQLDEEEYLCNFRGFNLDLILYKNKDGIGDAPKRPKMTLNTSYFGPFREEPKSSYTESQFQETSRFGIKGENAYFYLIKNYQTYEKLLLKKVSNWFEQNFEGWRLNVQKDIQRPIYYFELTKDYPKLNINIRNVGQGMSQVLPLIVRAYYAANKPTLIIMEQPELHLHPGAHGNLAELFADTSKEEYKNYLIETHSKNFILRIRRLIAEGKFDKNDLALYWVDFDEEKNTSSLVKINVDEYGKVDYWPENVFSESLDETIALRTAQKQK